MLSMMKLVNNTGQKSEKNICFVNTSLQLLRSIAIVKDFFQKRLYRSDNDGPTMPICDELSRLVTNSGQFSASVLRSLVGRSSGKLYLCDGTQQDPVEFLTILLQQVDKEIPVTNWDGKAFLQKFWGTEKTERKFLNNYGGTCTVCKALPRTEEESVHIIRLNIPDTGSVVTLNSIIENHYQENSDLIMMKCSECCDRKQHDSGCSFSGNCKMKN
jgi:hypothetical protein